MPAGPFIKLFQALGAALLGAGRDLSPIVAVIALVAINGVFVAAEFSLVASRRSRIDTLASAGSRGARWLLGVFDRPTGKDSYIAVAQLGITLASIGLGMYGEPAIAHWLYDPFESLGLSEAAAHTVGFLVALSIITYLHVVLGEMIPKALALSEPEGTSLRVNPVMLAFSLLFRPAVAFLNWTALSLMRLLRIPDPDTTLSLYSSEELAIVTDESAEGGALPEVQRAMINNIFELEDLTAEELMTSRSHIRALEHDASRADIAARIEADWPVWVSVAALLVAAIAGVAVAPPRSIRRALEDVNLIDLTRTNTPIPIFNFAGLPVRVETKS